MQRIVTSLVLLLVAMLVLWWWQTQADLPVRPTANIVAPAPPAAAGLTPLIPFRDITAEAGIAFHHNSGAEGDKLLPETMGGGVALFDYDLDGQLDLLFINSQSWSTGTSSAHNSTPALYHNRGDGHFDEVTAEAGLALSLYGMGVAVGDVNADGWPDLYITALGPNRLFLNRSGHFVEQGNTAGVAGSPEGWSTGASFFDYDQDGDLDLFVADYVNWSPAIDHEVNFQLTGIGKAYGPPNSYPGTQPHLYRNRGNGQFDDVSHAAGIEVFHPATGVAVAKGLGVLPFDFDADGDLDLFLGNDTVRNFLYLNLGDGHFQEVGEEYGIAFDRDGAATGAMGVDVADYRNDGSHAIVVGNFANEMSSLYRYDSSFAQFTDDALLEGVGPASRQALTFGLLFADFDLDGRLDLIQANGHLEEAINQVQSSQHYAQSAQLFWNCAARCDATFTPLPAEAMGDLHKPLPARGIASGDIDGDGDIDLVITRIGGPPLLLRNEQTLGHNWLRLRLRGASGNSDAIGARIEVTVDGVTQQRDVRTTRGYLSQSESVVTFGLGISQKIDAIRIHWPDGTLSEPDPSGLQINRQQTINHSSLRQ